jgi:hypothetical protein
MTEPPEQAPQQPNPPQAPYPYPYPTGGYPGGYPPPPPQPYGGYGYAPPPAAPRNGLGVTALVIAIVALLSSFSVVGGIVLGIAAVIIGFAGRSRAKRGEANNGGVALAGVILGFVAMIVGLAFIAIWVGVFKEVGAGDYIDCLQKAGQNQAAIQQCADQFKESVENRFSVTVTPTP